MSARHLPLAIACVALAVALNERRHRLAREAEKRRFSASMRRMAGASERLKLEASPAEGGRPLDEHERMVLTVKRGNDRIVLQRARVRRPSGDAGATQ